MRFGPAAALYSFSFEYGTLRGMLTFEQGIAWIRVPLPCCGKYVQRRMEDGACTLCNTVTDEALRVTRATQYFLGSPDSSWITSDVASSWYEAFVGARDGQDVLTASLDAIEFQSWIRKLERAVDADWYRVEDWEDQFEDWEDQVENWPHFATSLLHKWATAYDIEVVANMLDRA